LITQTVLVLVMLLTVQLTGLSCTNDLRILPVASATPLLAGHGASSDDHIDTGLDGCPCHMLFQSVGVYSLEVTAPFANGFMAWPIRHTPTLAHFLFHPPVTL
jgi:hypothetical protein